MKRQILFIFTFLILSSCSISYRFNGASVDYNLVKTISVKSFPNQAALVYAPLSQMFTEALRNKYISQTRLRMIDAGADLELEGEIVNYGTTDISVTTDGFASKTRLTLGIRVRYINNKKPSDDLDQTFSSYREYDNTSSLPQVEDELVRQMVNDLTDEIFNATLGNW